MIDIVDNDFDKTRIQLCPLNFYLGFKTPKYSSLISKNGSVFIRKNKTIMFILTGTLLPTICMQWSAKRGYCVKKIIITHK